MPDLKSADKVVKLTSVNLLAENMGLAERDESATTNNVDRIKDVNWLGRTFLIGLDDLPHESLEEGMFSTTAKYKFGDTTMGGNIAINSKHQSCPYADPRPVNARGDYNEPSIRNFDITHSGLGRDFSERLDDNAQRIYMRFGVPEFNNALWFLSHASSPVSRILANTGRAPHWLSRIVGEIAGSFTAGKALAKGGVKHAWKWLAAAIGARTALHMFAESAGTDFYYVKPTMPQYWLSVNTIVNEIAVTAGITRGVYEGKGIKARAQRGLKLLKGNNENPSEEHLKLLSRISGGVIGENGYVDVQQIAGKYHRMNNSRLMQSLKDRSTQRDGLLHRKYLKDLEIKKLRPSNPKGSDNLSMFKAQISGSMDELKVETVDGEKQVIEDRPVANKLKAENKGRPDEEENNIRWDMFKAELSGGSAFAVFEVEDTGSVSETFGNSTEGSAIGNTYNTGASTARTMKYDTAGLFSTASDGFDNLMGGIKDTFEIGTDAVTFGISGFLTNLISGGAIEMPDHWSGSTGKLPTANYKITATIPYDDPLSRIQYIYTPVAMLLAAVLPLKTGPHAHTSPFILELFDRGRIRTRKGIVDSVSITRGGGNLGFTKDGKLMRIEISFSVIDLSPAFSMPIATGSMLDLVPESAPKSAQDSNFTDYMSILAGRSITEEIYASSRVNTLWKRYMNDFKSIVSPSHFDMVIGSYLYDNPALGLAPMITTPGIAGFIFSDKYREGVDELIYGGNSAIEDQ